MLRYWIKFGAMLCGFALLRLAPGARLRTALFAVFAALWLAVPAPAQAGESSDFFCRDEGRMLDDDELLGIVFASEAARPGMPETIRDLGLEGLRARGEGCCVVLREDNPDLQQRGWLERLLFPPRIRVLIDFDFDPGVRMPQVARYSLSVCGDVIERSSPFRAQPTGTTFGAAVPPKD